MASPRLAGRRSAPRASRSSSLSEPGSTATGLGSFRPRPIPSRPAAITPPSARYGFALESEALSSTFVDSASSPRSGEGTRSAASRLSKPQAR